MQITTRMVTTTKVDPRTRHLAFRFRETAYSGSHHDQPGIRSLISIHSVALLLVDGTLTDQYSSSKHLYHIFVLLLSQRGSGRSSPARTGS